MPRSELAHLELLAEVDSLVARLNRWAQSAPPWQPAEKCRALVRRLTQRATSLRVRIEAPLGVATLGGTGTGKSALINAIVGAEVVRTGRSRPTTTRPTLVSRPGLPPESRKTPFAKRTSCGSTQKTPSIRCGVLQVTPSSAL